MTTVSAGIERVLRKLQSGNREQVNLLAAAITDTTGTSFTFSDGLRGIQAGAVLGVDTELVYVRDTDETAKSAVVLRGYAGTTAATHLINSQVVVNPKFPRADIFDAMNDGLDALSAEGLYSMTTVDLTAIGSRTAYDLTSVTNVSAIYEVRYSTAGSSKEWVHVPQTEWHLQRNASTSDFASGFALVIDGYVQPGRTIRVVYKDHFTRATAISDDLQTACKLPSTANDLLYVDAALRLVRPREVKRNFTESQGDTRRAAEVPAGAVSGSANGMERERATRLRDEIRRLQRKYPSVRY